MKTRLILFCIAFVAISVDLNAQEEQIIIIDKGDLKKRSNREPKINENDRVVKFSPLNMLVGEIGLGYEHKNSAKSSLDFEAGFTISELGIGTNQHLFFWGGNNVERSSGAGVFARVGYRYYPLDNTEALNRFYISPILKYKLRTYSFSSANILADTKNGSETQLNFLFDFGYQVWLAKSFSLDFYMGMGIGYRQYKSYWVNDIFENNEWTTEWVQDTDSYPRYVFDIGMKIGIGSKR